MPPESLMCPHCEQEITDVRVERRLVGCAFDIITAPGNTPYETRSIDRFLHDMSFDDEETEFDDSPMLYCRECGEELDYEFIEPWFNIVGEESTNRPTATMTPSNAFRQPKIGGSETITNYKEPAREPFVNPAYTMFLDNFVQCHMCGNSEPRSEETASIDYQCPRCTGLFNPQP